MVPFDDQSDGENIASYILKCCLVVFGIRLRKGNQIYTQILQIYKETFGNYNGTGGVAKRTLTLKRKSKKGTPKSLCAKK
jgi:hypothetical protein